MMKRKNLFLALGTLVGLILIPLIGWEIRMMTIDYEIEKRVKPECLIRRNDGGD